jgi:hypothetical protein
MSYFSRAEENFLEAVELLLPEGQFQHLKESDPEDWNGIILHLYDRAARGEGEIGRKTAAAIKTFHDKFLING